MGLVKFLSELFFNLTKFNGRHLCCLLLYDFPEFFLFTFVDLRATACRHDVQVLVLFRDFRL